MYYKIVSYIVFISRAGSPGKIRGSIMPPKKQMGAKVSVMLTDAQRAALEVRAAKDGVRLSDVVRRLVAEGLKVQ